MTFLCNFIHTFPQNKSFSWHNKLCEGGNQEKIKTACSSLVTIVVKDGLKLSTFTGSAFPATVFLGVSKGIFRVKQHFSVKFWSGH